MLRNQNPCLCQKGLMEQHMRIPGNNAVPTFSRPYHGVQLFETGSNSRNGDGITRGRWWKTRDSVYVRSERQKVRGYDKHRFIVVFPLKSERTHKLTSNREKSGGKIDAYVGSRNFREGHRDGEAEQLVPAYCAMKNRVNKIVSNPSRRRNYQRVLI